MSLHKQLQDYKQHQIDTIPATVLEILSRNTSLLQDQKLAEKALKTGDIFPHFNLSNSEGQMQALTPLLDKGPVIISFYRGGWCPYCVLELKALRDIVDNLSALNVTLVAISPETVDYTADTKQQNALNFIVLSDTSNQLASQCGLVYQMSESLIARFAGFGIDIQNRNCSDKYELPIPATYIVDRHRIIRYAFVEEDYISRAEPDEVLKVLQQLQL